MPDVKAAGTSHEPAVTAENSLPFARQAAELQNGRALIRELSGTITDQRQKAQSSDEDAKQKKSGDTAQISETRRWFHTDGTIPEDGSFLWVLDMEEDWQALLEWKPDPSMDLPQQLQELSELYLALLEAALKYAEGENLAQQLERLDSLLAEKLDLVMKHDLEQLTALLEETGQAAELDSIRSSLYRQTAGRTISYQDAHTLFTCQTAGNVKSAKTFLIPSSVSTEGMIYQPSGRQSIRFRQTCDAQQNSWKEQLRQRNETIANARKGIAENTFKQGSSVFCSGRELARANRFAAHIGGSGNLFKNPGISARNQEVTGLLAAVMSIKGQVYSGEGRQTGSIVFSLQKAIEKIIDQYLGQKDASKVYYHTLTVYKQMRDPQKAIQEGQAYAYRQFREKQKEPAWHNSTRYSKDSGFFRALLKGMSPEKDLAMGTAILKKDWQGFLYAIGNRPRSPSQSGPEIHSPWGILADTRIHRPGSGGNMEGILLGAAVVIITGLLAVICFQFMHF